MSMRGTVEHMLRRDKVVCATTFWQLRMPSARNRISEMRADGWEIATEPCTLHNWHQVPTVQYRLEAEPGDTERSMF